MIPQRLELVNFMVYRNECIEFSEPLICIYGKNGSGKSAIFDAITWALWGKSRLGNKLDELITYGEHRMHITFTFRYDNRFCHVTRTRIRGQRTTLAVHLGNDDLTEATIKDTQAVIDNLLGINYGTFMATAMIGQGDSGRFTAETPGTRKRVLGDILGLEIYQEYEEKAKEHLRAIERARNLETSRRIDAETAASKYNSHIGRRHELEIRITGYENNIDNVRHEIKVLDAFIAIGDRAQGKHDPESATALEAANAELGKFKTILDDRDRIYHEYQDHCALLGSITQARELLRHAQARIVKLESIEQAENRWIAQIRETIQKIDTSIATGTCEFCGTDLGADELLRATRDGLNEKLITRVVQAHEARNEHLNLRDDAVQQQAQIDSGMIRLEKLRHVVDEYDLLQRAEAEISVREQMIEMLRKRVQSTEDVKDKIIKAAESLKQKKDKLSLLDLYQDNLLRATSELGAVKATIKDALKAKKKLTRIEERLSQLSEQEEIFTTLQDAFSKNGIMALLIDAVLPEIEVEANRLLGRLTDSRMSIALNTQRTLKNKKISETLDVTIFDGVNEKDYAAFSGGQKFRIDFAVRIALSKILAKKSGAPLKSIFIDEGFGTQDEDGINYLMECIQSISNDFEFIMIITHIEELKNAFDHAWEVQDMKLAGSKLVK